MPHFYGHLIPLWHELHVLKPDEERLFPQKHRNQCTIWKEELKKTHQRSEDNFGSDFIFFSIPRWQRRSSELKCTSKNIETLRRVSGHEMKWNDDGLKGKTSEPVSNREDLEVPTWANAPVRAEKKPTRNVSSCEGAQQEQRSRQI